mgnify:CR=1 FL=1
MISMSGKGNCFDNAMVETFFKTLKSELVWRPAFQTRAEATVALADRLAGLSPMEDTVVLFGAGGSDAVDTAAKLVRRYWDLMGRPQKRFIVSRLGARVYSAVLAFINAVWWLMGCCPSMMYDSTISPVGASTNIE